MTRPTLRFPGPSGGARFMPGGLGRAIAGPAATTLLCAGRPGCATARGWARCG